MTEPHTMAIPNLRLQLDGSLYFGGASFYIFEAATAQSDAWMGADLLQQFLGYDCSALVGRLYLRDTCVGALVLPYGPWTMDHEATAERLDTAPEGTDLDLRELLAIFPWEPRYETSLLAEEGIIICPHEDLEVAMEDDEVLEVAVQGNLVVLVYSEDEDGIDGPILILRSDLGN